VEKPISFVLHGSTTKQERSKKEEVCLVGRRDDVNMCMMERNANPDVIQDDKGSRELENKGGERGFQSSNVNEVTQ
jgi:hypothetical protein